jgi:hypothetical protein
MCVQEEQEKKNRYKITFLLAVFGNIRRDELNTSMAICVMLLKTPDRSKWCSNHAEAISQ